MKIFLDTTDIGEIKELSSYGLVDGVTTNPSLVASSGKKYTELITEICKVVSGPVSAEVIATNYEKMIEEGLQFAKIAANVVVKLPLTSAGILACQTLSREHKIAVNVTLCFSTGQALIAAKAGARYVSPFVGRLDDLGYDGLSLIEEICQVYSNYKTLKTEVIVASTRSTLHVVESAKMGANIVTMSPKLLRQLFIHPLTDRGLAAFLEDWKKSGQETI